MSQYVLFYSPNSKKDTQRKELSYLFLKSGRRRDMPQLYAWSVE